MPQLRERALVLRAIPFSESTLIVRFYGAAHGKFSAIARGVRGAKSRMGGPLEAFMLVEARVSLREGADMGAVAGFDVLREWPRLRADLLAHALAAVVWETIDRGVEDAKPHPEIYDLALGFLESLEKTGEPESLAIHTLLRLISLLGYAPNLDESAADAPQTASLPKDEYDWRHYLLSEGRLVHTPPPNATREAVLIDAASRAFLRQSARLPEADFSNHPAPANRRKPLLNFLFRLLTHYLETDLKSLRFLRLMVWRDSS